MHSDADARALHVRLADKAWHLGPAPVTASYLNQEAILAAGTGADAVDPGYGDMVERHAVLVVLEAMKMQIPVTTPWPGQVRALLVAEGDSVTSRQPLADGPALPGTLCSAWHRL